MERVLSISPQLSSRQDLIPIHSTLERITGGLFRCWHRRMSWPITRDRQTYRACVRCGMCRSFDPKTWQSFGPFYRPLIKL